MTVRLPRRLLNVGVVLVSNGASSTPRHVCAPCLRKLSRLGLRHHSTSRSFAQHYFLANDLWSRNGIGSRRDVTAESHILKTAGTTTSSNPPPTPTTAREDVLPHRRRRRKDDEEQIPLDASSQLSNMSTQLPKNSLRQRFFTYLSLSKPRLTFLIVLTTTSAYTLFPVAVSPMSSSLALSPLVLLNLTTGTALTSACANALNMLMEPEHDAKMSRTKSRPLVRGLLTKRAALAFAVITGATGVGLLHFGVAPTVAGLSALNIFVYAGLYTPLKRVSVINTWVGAIVGGIPPLMGWTAAAAQNSSLQDATWRELLFDPSISAGGWLLAALLFAWQFPHFNALSFTIRQEYAAAGYKMLASVNPRKNGLIALRYSLLMFPICAGLSWVGVTSWSFLPVATAANAWMTREAWRFYKYEGAKGSARGLFWASVWQLPIVLVLAMVMKKGLWERVLYGGLDEDEWEEFTSPPEDHHEKETTQ